MAAQFSLKTFLRKLSVFLIMQYFQARDLLTDFPWAKGSIDDLADAILALGEPGRAAMQDFSDIHDMATQRGTAQMIKEAKGPTFNLDLLEEFSGMGGFFEKSMYVFMH